MALAQLHFHIRAGAETSTAEDENHGMLSLQFGELPAFCDVIGELIVGEDSPLERCQTACENPQLLDASSRVRCQREVAAFLDVASTDEMR